MNHITSLIVRHFTGLLFTLLPCLILHSPMAKGPCSMALVIR